jgi:peroxiredoxin Q/BCP
MPPSLDQLLDDVQFLLTGNRLSRLVDFRGQNLVLYFYPKANTPGCTQEGQDFRDAAGDFAALNTIVLGASRDGLKAQENFKARQGFPFDLVADTDEALCRLFDVIRLKKLYGRESLGVERSTFLIDGQGILRREWRKVQVKGHVQEVLEAARELQTVA